MKSPGLRRRLLGLSFILLTALNCRTTDLISFARPTPTPSRRPTTRPTFTSVPPTPIPAPTLAPLPTAVPATAARLPTLRPPPTARPVAKLVPTIAPPPPPPPPPPATADLYQGYYYRVLKNVCVESQNTRAEGTVYENGIPKNGVLVRVSNGNGGDPVIDDFRTGVDPSDYKHEDPSLKGKYRLGIAEGQRIDGNWWVFLVNEGGEQISVGAYFKTLDGPGCNTAIVDFAH